ncbi:MAG: type II toxin-antitoxin system VapC family toxin [Alphaproteobacteria bacterium]|nr:type II toxin-antitoxin system VapC family toxin [Alphaproteobacteria bacterium]
MTELVYWDSVCFLAYFQEEADRVGACQATLERAEAGDILIVTSTLTLAECLWLRNAPPIPKDRADIVRKFFRRSIIRLRNVTRFISEEAQTLVWDYGIKPKDAIHVATAIEAKIQTLETFDDGLISKSGKAGSPPLLIRKPLPSSQPRLF